MQVRINRAKLLAAIGITSKAVSSRPAIDVLKGIKAIAEADGSIKLYGDSVELGISYQTTAEEVTEPGEVVVDAKMFGETVKRLPGPDIIINSTDTKIVIKSGQSKFQLSVLPSKEFPSRDTTEAKYTLSVPQVELKKIIHKTAAFAATMEGKKPILTGILLDVKDGKLTAVASDGQRLARVVTEKPIQCDDIRFVVPVTAMRELLKITEDTDEKVVITSDERQITFSYWGGRYTLTTRLLNGEYLNYEKIMSSKGEIRVTVNKSDMIELLERVLIIVNSENSGKGFSKLPVKLEIGDSRIKAVCTAKKGAITDEIEATITGDDITIGFNCDYLLDALRVCNKDEIDLYFMSPVHGVFVCDTPGITYLVLPVRLHQ